MDLNLYFELYTQCVGFHAALRFNFQRTSLLPLELAYIPLQALHWALHSKAWSNSHNLRRRWYMCSARRQVFGEETLHFSEDIINL